jgi:hypothetical protein
MYWRAKGQLLPHPDTLRKYKNCLQQKPGFLPQMFDWMVQESERLNLQQHDRVGTVILDEVSIQQDLAVLHKGCQTSYTGQVSITPICQAFIAKRSGKKD